MIETLYKPEAHDTQADWNLVFGRIEAIGIPEDKHERASDIAHHFSSGLDIEMFSKALHDVLVPDVESMPMSHAMKAIDPNTGKVEKYFAGPDARSAIFEKAADYIKKLSEMRISDDEDGQFLARAASIVALATVQAHVYANGNGRLARTMAEIIRNGTKNKDDIMLAGTERDVSQKAKGGFRIHSYRQLEDSAIRGETDDDVLRMAASLDIPLKNEMEYADRAGSVFSSPHDYMAD